MNPTSLRRIAPYLILLFAFAVRIHAIDTTLIDGDRANPHGIGLLLVHQLSRGEPTQFLTFADDASTGLPNPPFINYVWAIVSLFDRSLFSATAFGLMANVLAVAAVYVTGQRCFSWTTGMIAAALMAGSNWGVYLARGLWHPGHLEVTTVLGACLMALALHAKRPKQLFAGFGFVFFTAGSYFGALFMPFQAAIATVAAGALDARLRRAWFAGVDLCSAGLMAFLVAMIVTGRLTPESAAGLSLFRREAGVMTETDLAARDITPINRDPVGQFLRLATNRDYALTWTDPRYQGYAMREPLSQATAVTLSALICIGLARLAWNWRRPVNRFLLLWASLPIIALLVIAAYKYDFRVAIYYLLMTTPVQYLAGGYGLASVLQFGLRHLRPEPGTPITLVACGGLMALSAWNFSAAAESIYEQPFIRADFMPLKWTMQLSRLWQRECTRINGSNFWWDLSLIESPDRWQPGGTHFNDGSSIWTVAPQGGTCALKQIGDELPNSELLPLRLDDGSVVRTYRSLPYAVGSNLSTTVNLGWTLLNFDASPEATAGNTITVRHAWRVDVLPTEPYASWYFAPFVKLIAPDGRVVVELDSAAALPGWQWRPGEVQLSAVALTLPGDLRAGDYTLQSSLFDPNQRKNAVYFNVDEPGKPILTLERKIKIR